jgi:hypothetical protein
MPTYDDDVVASLLAAAGGDVAKAADLLLQDANRVLTHARHTRAEFHAQILDEWGPAIDGLDLLIALVYDAAEEWRSSYGEAELGIRSRRRAALAACTGAINSANDVSALIVRGCGTAAFARWRTLHELNVVARILRISSDDVLERYLDREDLRYHDSVLRLHRAWKDGRLEGSVPREAVLKARDMKVALTNKYGAWFLGDFGWAHELLYESNPAYRERFDLDERPSGPRFSELQAYADLREYALDYIISSTAIHASPALAGFLIHAHREPKAGPSLYGLGFPGSATAVALADVTSWLLEACPDPPDDEFVRWSSVLSALAAKTAEAFQSTNDRLEENLQHE